MKIKNISSKTLEIPFKKKSGQLKKVTLLPGHIMYCEEHSINNNQVIVYKRKKIIEVTNDETPKNGEMYHPYGVLSHEEILKLKKETPEEKHHSIELVEDEDEGEEIEVSIDEEIEKNLVSDIVIEPTISMDSEINPTPPKNKGGRPKGSTKKKKGRPKVKKPIGRPMKTPKPQKEEVEAPELKSNDNNSAI